MEEEELRRGYNGFRILMDVDKVLDPVLPAQGIYLAGAQVAMLRTVCHYLNRRSTFVGEYHETYYKMPDDETWDAIETLVADMEDRLMGDGNTMWGYKEEWAADLGMRKGSAGTAQVSLDPVEAGEVLVLQAVSWYNNTGVRGRMQIYVKTGTPVAQLAMLAAPAIKEPVLWSGNLVLAEGTTIVVKQFSSQEDDYYLGAARGYKMAVPA